MERTTMVGMAGNFREGISLRRELIWHLTSNHVPSVSEIWVDSCMSIIRDYNNGRRDLTVQIERPDNKEFMEAIDIVEMFHLESFLDSENEG